MNTNENLTPDEYEPEIESSAPDDAIDVSSYDTSDVDDLSALAESNAFTDSLDIDAALAALETLPAVMAEREAEDAAERVRLAALKADEEERKEAQRIAAEEYALWLETYHLPSPPAVKMQRGRIQTVVPALLLMASGAYLTFTQTMANTTPEPSLILLIVCGVIGLSLISYWLASERWARGALFSGLVVLLGGGAVFYTLQPDAIASWEFLVMAIGLAVFLSAILSKPFNGKIAILGLAILAAGGFMLAVANGLVNTAFLQILTTLAPYILIAYVVLMLIPLILRRNVHENRD